MEPTALFAAGLAGGLIAGSTSCTAMQGGLLLGLGGRGRTAVLVAVFVGGRFAAHVAAGALLGLLGSAVRLGPTARAVLLVLAGLLVIVFGTGLLRRGRRCAPEGDEPAPGLARAAFLGALTILVPCGVTIGTEIIAVSTGSVLGGVAVMAGFVTGSSPALALLGLVVRRVATGRLALIGGIVALVAGLFTVASGLRLGGWLPEAGGAAAATAVVRGGTQTVTVWATDRGYRPGGVTARSGVPTEIVFRAQETAGCTRTVTINGRDLPLPGTVRLPPQRPGTLRYACSMGMFVGFVKFT
ncbi:urease accessory protein UreH domain-containing protein [Streptosporangium soli]|nr:sulfite exporter TauE/SafE family protein [Streptosporangium sp. KLBMP 9127]